MTPEKLEMYRKLQPLFKEKMLIPYIYDLHYCERWGKLSVDYPCVICSAEKYSDNCKSKIMLPLPIDTVNPKRGLWGMVDWSKLRYEQWGPDGEMAIYKPPYVVFNEEMGIPVKDDPFIIDTPTTAILKALCDQEGV